MLSVKPLRALLVALYCSGCWSADGGDGDGTDGGAGEPIAFPTDFVYDNRGTDPVVLGGNCGETWPSLTQDGKALGIDATCVCTCEDFDSPAGCGGCPDICLDTSELVVPGVPHTYSWDGLALVQSRPECYTLQAPAMGTVLTAHVCHDVEASDDPRCVSSDFEYGVEREVTLIATPGPQDAAQNQSIAIENQTGVPIEIVIDRCGDQGWLEFAEEDPRIVTSVFCACSCNDAFEIEACPDCGACAAEQSKTLAPGETHFHDWDGRFWYQYESDCARNYAMPGFYAPLVRACYTKLGDDTQTCTKPQSLFRGGGVPMTIVATE